MRHTVLGLDTSSVKTGFGVIQGGDGKPMKMLGLGVIGLNPKLRHPARLCVYETHITELFNKYPEITRVAIEDLKSVKNAKVVRVLQSYITVAIMATWKATREDPILLPQTVIHSRIGAKGLTPQQKKGMKRDDISNHMKSKVQTIVNRAFNLKLDVKDFDVSDAIAVAMAGLAGPK